MSNYRRTIARVVLPIISIWLCWLPSQAYAALPAPAGVYAVAPSAIGAASNVIAGPWAGSAASAAGLTSAGAIAVGAAVGASALYVGIKVGYFVVDNLTGGYSRIPLTTANPVPAPSAPATATPVPAYTYQGNFNGIQWSGASVDEVIANHIQWYANSGITELVNNRSVVSPTQTYVDFKPHDSWGYVNAVQSGTTCPSGYSGANCALSNARAVTPDHSQDYERSGTSLTPAAGDVDFAVGAVSSLPSGGLLVQDQTANGEPRHYKIIPAADGGSQVEFIQPVTNAVGDTGTQKTVITVAPDGTITGKVQTTTGEQLGQDPVTGLPVLNPAPAGSTFTPSSPSGSTVTFPNDYARAGEAVRAANSINPKLDTLHNDLSVTAPVSDPVAPVAGDLPTFGNTFTNLLSWQLPAHAGACPTPSVDLSTLGLGSHQLTSHCGLLQDHSAPIHNAMVAVFTILALFVVLRA